MKLIPLNHGYFAKVDDDDFEWLSKWRWYAVKGGKTVYAARGIVKDDGKSSVMQMHRQILGVTDPKIQVDHRFGDGLDNTRENIRLCTRSQNLMNRGGFVGSSQYKGVTWNKKRKLWLAGITINKKLKIIGGFLVEEDAARAYNYAAKVNFGDFAKYNNVSPLFLIINLSRNLPEPGFHGVYIEKKTGIFTAYITVKGKRVNIGRFNDPHKAAKAYDEKAKELLGDRARLNFTDKI